MNVELPGGRVGEVSRIEVDGRKACLVRGENHDVVLKVAGREKEMVVREDPDAVAAAVRDLTGQPPG